MGTDDSATEKRFPAGAWIAVAAGVGLTLYLVLGPSSGGEGRDPDPSGQESGAHSATGAGEGHGAPAGDAASGEEGGDPDAGANGAASGPEGKDRPVAAPEGDGGDLSATDILTAAGIELGLRSGMTVTGNRDRFLVQLPDGGPPVTVERRPLDPARPVEAMEAPSGTYSAVITTRGRRFLCGSESPGERLMDVKDLCDSITAVPPEGEVVGIDCQSVNVDRDLFTVRLRVRDAEVRSCFTAGWVTTPGNDTAGFGFRADVSADGVVTTLEVAADVPDYAAYEELRGCVYPILKKMTFKMLEVGIGQVSCELRWALAPDTQDAEEAGAP